MHSLLLAALFYQVHGSGDGEGVGKDKGRQQGDDKTGKIQPHADEGQLEDKREVEITLVSIPKQKPEVKVEGVKDCKGDRWYGGIGIMSDFYTKKIEYVAPGYPAAKAGLRLGDIIMSDDSPTTIRGEVGSVLTITVVRNGEIITLDITRGKICLDDDVSQP